MSLLLALALICAANACLLSAAYAPTCMINIQGGPDVIKHATLSCQHGEIVVGLDDLLLAHAARLLTGIKHSPKTCPTKGCLLAICSSRAEFINSSISQVQAGVLHKERTGVICVQGSSNVTFTALKMHGNYGSGIVARDFSRVTVEASVFSDGLASGGAAVLALEHSQVQMKSSFINNNTVDGYYGGGGLAAGENSTMFIERCTISHNTARELYAGGGLGIVDNATVTISNSIISNNIADGGGAGLAVFYDSVVLITNGSRLVENNASGSYSGGAMLVVGNSKAIITGGSVLERNTADLDTGGAFMISGEKAQCLCTGNSTLRNNSASNGGAAGLAGRATLIMGDQDGSCTFEGNVAPFGSNVYAGGQNNLEFVNTNINISSDSVIWSRTNCVIGETMNVICQKCRPGLYSLNPRNRSCDVCPAVGANCTGGDSLIPLDGYWHSSNYSTQFHRCLHTHTVCLSSNQCATGYAGLLCGACAESYSAGGAFTCVLCTDVGRHVALYILFSLLSIALVTITAHATWIDNAQGGNGLKASHMLHVVILFVQFLVLMGTIQIPWPAALAVAFRASDAVFGAFGGQPASLNCILKWALGEGSHIPLAVVRHLITLLAPIGMYAAVVVCEVLWWCAKQLLQRLLLCIRHWRRTAVKLCDVIGLNTPLNLKAKLPVIALVVLSVSYPFLVRTSLSFFACVPLDDATEPNDPYPQYAIANAPFGYWIHDMNEACWSPSGYHLKWAAAVGIPCAVLFCIGVPAATVLWLSTHVEAMAKDKHFQSVYGFLYRNYREKRYWFEAVTRVLMAGVCAVSAFRYTLGAYYATLLLNGAFCLFFGLQLILKPFEYQTLHRMQLVGSACLYFVAYITLTLFTVGTETTDAYKQAAGGIALAAIICYLLWCAYLIAWHARDVVKRLCNVVFCRTQLQKQQLGLLESIPTTTDVGQK